MSQTRLNSITLFIAKRSSGKTTFTKQVIAAQPKKTLIIDTVDHPSYRDGFELVEVERLRYWKKGNKRIIVSPASIKKDAEILSKYVYNTFIIFEDATKYLREDTPDTVFQMIYDCKQKNNDLYFIYHNFSNILPEIRFNADFITLGKLTEDLRGMKLPEKEQVVALQKKVNALCEKKGNDFQRLTIRVS